jgi:shikimate kinase
MPLWLIGMMGSGKTEVGARLASRTGSEFLDTDRMVENEVQTSVAEIFSTEGELAFRSREKQAVRKAATYTHAVVATGGGVVIDPDNVATMRGSGPVIWLQADPVVLAGRVDIGEARPLLERGNPVERLASILQERSTAYDEAADHVVVTDRADIEQVVGLVEELWNASS